MPAAFVFRLGGRWFGVPPETVEALVSSRLPQTLLPGAPPHIPAVVSHRGRALGLFDARAFLGLGDSGEARGRLLVLEAGGMHAGVPVEEVRGLVQLEGPGEPSSEPYARALHTLGEAPLALLDVEGLLQAAAPGGAQPEAGP